jgi:hypothetical protein
MPINSSSIPALRIARKLKKRRRYAAGGSPTNPALWDVPEEELPAGSGYSPFTSAAAHIAKRMFWDLPHEAINAAKNTSYGLRREDYTDAPPDYSPDPNSPLGGIGVKVPRGGWQPTDPMIGASLEGATNVMGGTALSTPGRAAGEFIAGAGPRDPALWHGISKVKLPKPVSEMSAVHAPTATFAERFANPADFQGGTLVPLIGDRTRAGSDLLQVNGYKFDQPVPMQGGHGFMANPSDPGAAWASGKPITNQLANLVRAQEGPVYGAYTAMGERSGDFSHHVADTLVRMLPHTKVPKVGRAAFDADMREFFPDFPGVGSKKLQTYLDESPGAVRAQFVKLMDTAKHQGAGFPSVAEARFATTDPRLLNAETGASGLSMARLHPETFPGSHRSYDTNLAGDYAGGLPTSIPKEVMYPDIVQAIERYRDALPGYKPTIDYLMTRTPKGLPRVQKADQQWVDTVSKHLEDKGFKLGAGANDRRAAAVVGANEMSKEATGLRRYYSQRSWPSEEEARRQIVSKIERENANTNSFFPPTDPRVVDELTFVRHGNGVKISQAGTSTRKPVEIFAEPTGSAPPVDWTRNDLINRGTAESALKSYGRGRGEAKQGYVNLSELPQEKLAGGKRDYDWEELRSTRTNPPPATVRINKNGTMSILDGNHRIHYWREQGYDQIPAFIIDERTPGKVLGAGATDKRAAALAAADDVLAAEKGLTKSREYPIAPRDEWYGDANYETTGGQMTRMSPDDFLAKARPLDIDDLSRENIDLLKQHIEDGRTLDPLALYRSGKEDGRHRAHAAKELGISEVPVLTWPDWSTTLGSGATDKRAASLAAVDDVLEAERRLAGASTHEPGPAAPAAEPAAAAPAGEMGPGGGGALGVRGLPEAQATAARWAGERKPLEGLPGALKIGEDYFVPGPIAKIHDLAEDYMRTIHPDRPYTPPTKYHPIDPDHSKAIAQAYEEMKHTPNDPATKASYDALIDETAKQYQAIKATELKIEPIPAGMPDPYAANPRLAAVDVAENNHLWFFPTEGGFGTLNKISDNPMLRKTGEKIGDHELLANDMFRVVHDYFGHLKEGHGFRAAGEDNAWRTHAQMYSDLARPAMTTETRGQNSWVNYGPHGEKNRTASGADTVYADQKVGLMPEWTMRDRNSPAPIMLYHGTPHSFGRFDISKIGSGEGNQAYGHGLYFAGHSPVSEWYRHQLQTRADPLLSKYGLDETGITMGFHLADAGGDAAKLAAEYAAARDKLIASGGTDKATVNQIKEYDRRIAYLNDPERMRGHVYEVAADVNPEHLLNYDAPFKEQTPYVQGRTGPELEKSIKRERYGLQATLESGSHKGRPLLPGNRRAMEGRLLMLEQAGPEALKGSDIYTRFGQPSKSESEAARLASQRLHGVGVPGLHYADAGSRGPGAGSRNYVMFSDDMLKILRKYGVVGIPAAGVLGADGLERRAEGGAVNAAMDVARRIKRAKGGAVHVGPIMGDTDGRADEVPMEVPDGAYVLTADHVSSMGEGNTLAGFKKLNAMFPKSAAHRTAKREPVQRASGGAVPIYAADGEYVICPEDIIDRWGDLDEGHRILDAWQTASRKEHVNTLRNLAPPAQD